MKSNAKTLEPLNKSGLGAGVAVASVADPAPVDAVETWMADHPKEFTADPVVTPDLAPPAEPNAAITAPPSTDPVVEPQSTPPVGATPPAAVPAASEAPPVTEPPAAPVPVAAAPVTPAATEPVRITNEAKFIVAEGVEPWSGEQIVEALKQRAEALPRAAEADKFEKLLGYKYEDAEKNWQPVLKALAANPPLANFLDTVLFGSPDKAAYLQLCAEHFDREEAPAPTVTPTAQADPAVTAKIQELEAFKTKYEAQEFNQRVAREWAECVRKYPFLATNPAYGNDLAMTADALRLKNANATLLDALATKTSIYDALLVAQQTREVPQAAPVVPALNGSTGAAPAGARQTTTKPFDPSEDPVEEWLKTHPE